MSSSSGSSTTLKPDPLSKLAHFGGLREPSRPWVPRAVLGALCALLLAAIGGMVVSGLVFGGNVRVYGPCLGQSFVLFASLLAFPYIFLHVWSSRENHSLLRSQAFQHPLHSWTTIVARMDLIAWFVALITVCVAVARGKGEMVHLRVDLFVCVLAFLANLTTLCAVEMASDPFILPGITPAATVLSRTNTILAAEKLDLSVSRRGSVEHQGRDRESPMGPRPLTVESKAAAASAAPAPTATFPRSNDSEATFVADERGVSGGNSGKEARRSDPSPRMPASWPSPGRSSYTPPPPQQQQPLGQQTRPLSAHPSPHRLSQIQQQQQHNPPPSTQPNPAPTPVPPPAPPSAPRLAPATTPAQIAPPQTTDWRHDWSALAGDTGLRRTDRGAPSSTLSSSTVLSSPRESSSFVSEPLPVPMATYHPQREHPQREPYPRREMEPRQRPQPQPQPYAQPRSWPPQRDIREAPYPSGPPPPHEVGLWGPSPRTGGHGQRHPPSQSHYQRPQPLRHQHRPSNLPPSAPPPPLPPSQEQPHMPSSLPRGVGLGLSLGPEGPGWGFSRGHGQAQSRPHPQPHMGPRPYPGSGRGPDPRGELDVRNSDEDGFRRRAQQYLQQPQMRLQPRPRLPVMMEVEEDEHCRARGDERRGGFSGRAGYGGSGLATAAERERGRRLGSERTAPMGSTMAAATTGHRGRVSVPGAYVEDCDDDG